MIGFHKLLLDRLAPFAYKDQVTPHLATFHATLVRIGLRVRVTQCAERILNKIAKPLNETFIGLKFMAQGFRICFVQNLDSRA